ncbi:MAG: beta-ketoacyl reductase, partial [Bacteroidota bacterium]
QGVRIDWNIFYAQTNCRKVEAPTYPFEQIRCWVENQPRATPTKTNVEDWLYDLRWEKSESPKATIGALTNGTFVVVMDGAGLGEKLVNQLKERGNQCIQVQLGSEYVSHADGSYTINAGLESDYSRLVEALAVNVDRIDGLIHLGMYAAVDKLSSETLDSQVERGVLSQFYLLRAFQGHLKRNFYVAFVTANGCSVAESEAIVPTHSVSAGLLKGLMAEYPLLKIFQLDFAFSADLLEQTCAHILVELAHEQPIRFIAYRQNTRYVQQLCKIAASAKSEKAIKLTANGVYIITGGISGIGFEVAKTLAQQEKIHLIVLGRTNLPAKEEWKDINLVLHEKDITQKIANVWALEALGAKVDYYALDLGHLPSVKEVFQTIGEKVEKVHGILHSAGVSGNWEPLYRKKTSDFKDTLLPKVQGTVYLDECSQFLSPDFFVSFSSLNAVVAQKNSADYAVANAFLDAYAVSRNGSQRFLSINWPGWYETGMSLQKKTAAAGMNNDPLQPISTKDGLRALELVLAISRPRVLVANVNLAAFYVNPYFLIEEDSRNNPVASTEPSFQLIDSQVDERATPTERKVIRIWQEVLRANNIRLEDDFFDIGGHSLNGSQVINRIEKEFGVKVEIDDLFENGTVTALADLIDLRQSTG